MPILYADGTEVEPLVFPNGISQRDVVRQVVASLESYDVVEVESAPGTGKTHIAMGIISEFADVGAAKAPIIDGRHRGVLVEPINAIATQIQYDFTFRFKIAQYGREIPVGTVFGRRHYICPVIDGSSDKAPCVGVGAKKLDICARFAPVVTEDEYQFLQSYVGVAISYNCVSGTCYKIRGLSTGCPYYDAHSVYVTHPIIVTNPQKYRLHALTGVLPEHYIVVIDEADAAMPSLELIYTVSQSEMKQYASKYRVPNLYKEVEKTFRDGYDYIDIVNIHSEFWKTLLATIQEDVKNCFSNCTHDDCTSECLFKVYDDMMTIKEKLKMLGYIQTSTNVRYGRSAYRNDVRISMAPGDMSQYFRSIFKDKKVVLMSATPLTDYEMRVYGMHNRGRVVAYRKLLGTVYVGYVVGLDKATRYVIDSPEFRADFINALVENIRAALVWKPTLVHVVAWDIWENDVLLMMLEKIGVTPDAIDRDGKKILEMRDGKRDIVISSHAIRGIDLYGDLVRSIVVPKAPYPTLNDPRVIYYKSVLMNDFDKWYRRKMEDQLFQLIARGVRGKDDWVVVFSPDVRVYEALRRLEIEGKINVVWFKAPRPKTEVPQDMPIQCNDNECTFTKGEVISKLIANTSPQAN